MLLFYLTVNKQNAREITPNNHCTIFCVSGTRKLSVCERKHILFLFLKVEWAKKIIHEIVNYNFVYDPMTNEEKKLFNFVQVFLEHQNHVFLLWDGKLKTKRRSLQIIHPTKDFVCSLWIWYYFRKMMTLHQRIKKISFSFYSFFFVWMCAAYSLCENFRRITIKVSEDQQFY